ncbi:MAG: cytochrome d ubiquinol oxidase subunit II [Candidatus Micrarchaeaceae archaeon]
MMYALIFINYIVFALFLTAFIIEVGIALLLLISYNTKEKLLKYLMPMWEIDGTFAIFYVVDLESTYPSILLTAGTMYILPVLIAALFFIFRNAFLAYGEYMGKESAQKAYIRIYGIAMLVVAFIAISVLASSVSGIGVNLAAKSLDIIALLFNPFSLLIFFAVALLSLFAAMVIFGIRHVGAEVLAAVAAVVFVLIALQSYAHYIIANVLADPVLIIIPAVLIAVAILLQALKKGLARYLTIVALFFSVLLFELAEYPYWFNKAVALQSILVSGPSASYLLAFSIGGIAVLAVLIGILIYINLMHKGDVTQEQDIGY